MQYKDYSQYLSKYFPGVKVQKISINTGMSCPNRDGTIGTGGCIYCNNRSFAPSYCFDTPGVKEQIEAGKKFFGRKYPNMRYLAYFQTYTGTHNIDLSILESQYREALEAEKIVGLCIGTRPDCLNDEILEMLAVLNYKHPVFVEIGAESMHDATLRLINRGHNSEAIRDAIRRLDSYGLHAGAHLIAGLPGESDEDVLTSVSEICTLPIESLKLHHLQILRHTPLHKMWENGDLKIREYDLQQYLSLCAKIVEIVPNHICIERFLASAPPDMVVSPRWGIKNYEFTNLLKNRLAAK